MVFSHRAMLIESTAFYAAQKCFENRQTSSQFLLKNLCTNIARRNILKSLYSKYLIASHKLHNSFHRSIKVSFTLFEFSSAMCSQFPGGCEREVCMSYVFYIDWVGLFNSIAAYLYLEGRCKSFGNQWAEASKAKIIDCFQTPAGRRNTNQNSSQGCLKLVLQILQPFIQSEKKWSYRNPFPFSAHIKFLFS